MLAWQGGAQRSQRAAFSRIPQVWDSGQDLLQEGRPNFVYIHACNPVAVIHKIFMELYPIMEATRMAYEAGWILGTKQGDGEAVQSAFFLCNRKQGRAGDKGKHYDRLGWAKHMDNRVADCF